MLRLVALSSVVLMSLGTLPALAGGPAFAPFWALKHACDNVGVQAQCAVQYVTGDNDYEITEQYTRQYGPDHNVQVALTGQDGDNDQAYTGQFGKNQSSLTLQTGDNNGAFTYQKGKDAYSESIQTGNGEWSSTSSIGTDTHTSVVLTSF